MAFRLVLVGVGWFCICGALENGWIMTSTEWLFLAFYLYLLLIFLKRAVVERGISRSISLITAFLVVPSTAFLHLYGHWDFSHTGVLNSPASIWVVRITNPEGGPPHYLNTVTAVFAVSLIYIMATLLVSLLTRAYERRGNTVHGIYRPLLKWGLVLLGTILYLGANSINLSTLFIGMGAASIVAGFALQESLANLITGFALEVEGIVRPGRWIEPESGPAGQVTEKGWRATKLRTIGDRTVMIPNKTLAGGKLSAYGFQDLSHARTLGVSAAYKEAPLKVKEILRQIMLMDDRILKDPHPRVFVSKYNDFSIDYTMMFWIRDYAEHMAVEDSVLTQVWYAFKSDGVEIPFPVRHVVQKNYTEAKEDDAVQRESLEKLAHFLGQIGPLKDHLGWAELEFLARNGSKRTYHPGEELLRRGEAGDSVYFVMEGDCTVKLPSGETKTLGVGEFFGEMALFHQGHRTADVQAGAAGAVVAKIGREPILTVFRSHPDLKSAFELTHELRSDEAGLTNNATPTAKKPLGEALLDASKRWLLPW